MLVVLVHVHVKADSIQAFKEVSLDNAKNSLLEPGIAQFEVIQSNDDPSRFVLIEAYRTTEATAAHKETAHYKRWKDAVEKMMAEPRASSKYTNISPMAGE